MLNTEDQQHEILSFAEVLIRPEVGGRNCGICSWNWI